MFEEKFHCSAQREEEAEEAKETRRVRKQKWEKREKREKWEKKAGCRQKEKEGARKKMSCECCSAALKWETKAERHLA